MHFGACIFVVAINRTGTTTTTTTTRSSTSKARGVPVHVPGYSNSTVLIVRTYM
eukprot:COSAG02_NODE_39982_length_410_cov_1.135048_1_plen_53_part_10